MPPLQSQSRSFATPLGDGCEFLHASWHNLLLTDFSLNSCNEDARFQEHYVKFNITELQHKAAETVNRPYCSQIIKMADGGFNKVFLLTMDDGSEVVARIPTPIAGPRGLTTASEVATMRFLRETLHIPVPRVLTYSPTSDNPVGAEYILMKRLRGEALGPKWLSLSKPTWST